MIDRLDKAAFARRGGIQMRHSKRWMVALLVLAGLQLAACGQAQSGGTPKIQPAEVTKGDDGFNRVKLTEKAAQRLNIKTAAVVEEQVNGAQRKVIPYAAMIYDLQGKTWTYTSPENLIFVRRPITVDHIEGDKVFLVEGPAAGTAVVTVGVAQLYGTDTGIGK
jgi:hypothetical protein